VVSSNLFAELFLVEPEEMPVPDCTFDDERGYAIGTDGRPVVEVASAGQTQTVSEVRGEAPDSDPTPDTQTWTFVEAEGADVHSFASTETHTRIRAEAPDDAHMSAPGQETFTKVRAEGRAEASLYLDSLVLRRVQVATMTKTAIVDLSDDDRDD
jgi:hypothetical protein